LPVIIASSVVIEILQKSGMQTDIASGSSSYLYQATGIKSILENGGLDVNIVNIISNIVNKIFDITWKSGIQIILYLTAFQSIPKSYYEVCNIEGATKWDAFWKVTFPILSPFTLICVVYSIIDNFTSYQNKVMVQIDEYFNKLDYSFSAAMSWIYFIIILVIIAIITRIMYGKIVYIDD
jgi:ABC-type sugar transport system permease subunit